MIRIWKHSARNQSEKCDENPVLSILHIAAAMHGGFSFRLHKAVLLFPWISPTTILRIILLPDTDEELKAYTQWYDVAQQVMQSFLWPKQNRIYVSDFLERHASADQKRRKIDLVDYIQEST